MKTQLFEIKSEKAIKMHILQPKHSKLKEDDKEKLLDKLNVSLAQLPKIKAEDTAIADLNVEIGDIIKIERKEEKEEFVYYRVVV